MSGRPARPSAGAAVSHLVLNVRDIEASHRFYTDIIGFEQCGKLDSPDVDMRFYRSSPEHHHQLALCQMSDPAAARPPEKWKVFGNTPGLNHMAISYPDRDSWLAQITYMQERDVPFLMRGNHGMTHSVYVADPDGNGVEVLYDLPADVWQDDVNAALSYFETLPRRGPEALEDSTDYRRFPARS